MCSITKAAENFCQLQDSKP